MSKYTYNGLNSYSFTNGKTYDVAKELGDNTFIVIDDDGDEMLTRRRNFVKLEISGEDINEFND